MNKLIIDYIKKGGEQPMQFTVSTSLPIKFEKIKDIEDSRFMSVKIDVAHEGLNLNGSYFSKELLKKMGENLAGVPVVGFLTEDTTGNIDFSGHEMKITVTDDGVDCTYLGSAFGCILENNNARFETKLCDDGVSREFLVVDAILWRKFDKYTDIFEENGFRWQSMELLPESIQGYFAEDKAFHFTDATVEAVCALGINVSPAMRNATIQKYSHNTIKDQLNEMFAELKEANLLITGTDNKNSRVFTIDANQKKNNSKGDEQVAKRPKSKKEIAEQFSLTTNKLYDELSRRLGEKTFKTTNWYGEEYEVSKFYLTDFDENFVYAVDRESKYIDVKIPYSMSGDDVTLNFEETSRIKWSPLDWESGNSELIEDEIIDSFAIKIINEAKNDFNKLMKEKKEIFSKLEKASNSLLELNEKYSTLEDVLAQKDTTIDEQISEIESLNQFKLNIEHTQRKEKVNILFERFKKNLTKEEIESWKEKEPTFSEFEEFEKEVKLFVADKIIADDNNNLNEHNTNTTSFTKMGVPLDTEKEETTTSMSVWDKLEKE